MKSKKGMPGPAPFKMQGKSPMMKALVGNQHKLPEHLKKAIKAAPETKDDVSGKKIMDKDYAAMMGGYKSPLNYGSPIKKGPGDEVKLDEVVMRPKRTTLGGPGGQAVFEDMEGKVKPEGSAIKSGDGREGKVIKVIGAGPGGRKTSKTRQIVQFFDTDN